MEREVRRLEEEVEDLKGEVREANLMNELNQMKSRAGSSMLERYIKKKGNTNKVMRLT